MPFPFVPWLKAHFSGLGSMEADGCQPLEQLPALEVRASVASPTIPEISLICVGSDDQREMRPQGFRGLPSLVHRMDRFGPDYLGSRSPSSVRTSAPINLAVDEARLREHCHASRRREAWPARARSADPRWTVGARVGEVPPATRWRERRAENAGGLGRHRRARSAEAQAGRAGRTAYPVLLSSPGAAYPVLPSALGAEHGGSDGTLGRRFPDVELAGADAEDCGEEGDRAVGHRLALSLIFIGVAKEGTALAVHGMPLSSLPGVPASGVGGVFTLLTICCSSRFWFSGPIAPLRLPGEWPCLCFVAYIALRAIGVIWLIPVAWRLANPQGALVDVSAVIATQYFCGIIFPRAWLPSARAVSIFQLLPLAVWLHAASSLSARARAELAWEVASLMPWQAGLLAFGVALIKHSLSKA